jgi:hypothetical protein
MHAIHVTYRTLATAEEARGAAEAFTAHLVAVPGFVGKVWLDAGEGDRGGFYLFKTAADAEAFAAGPLLGALRAAPGVSEVTVRGYAVDGEATARTAPFLGAAAT